MKKKYLSILMLLITNLTMLEARDTMGFEWGINAQFLEGEKINQNDETEKRKNQTNQNTNVDLFALIDVGREDGLFIGPYATFSITNNGDNKNNYNDITDYAPYGAGALIRYEFQNSKLINCFTQMKIGYMISNIGKREARGYMGGIGFGYKIDNNWNIGLQYNNYQLEYKKSHIKTDANINSVGIFVSYDIF